MRGAMMFVAVVGFGVLAGAGCTVKKTTSSSGAGGSTASSSTQVSTGVAAVQSSSSAASVTTSAAETSSGASGGGTFVAHCNPVTNEGCAAGDACDASQDNTFVCFPPPNDVDLCGTCDNSAGPFCKGGFGCTGMTGCAKYCCDDGDCGSGTCVKDAGDGQPIWGGVDLGYCLDSMGKPACDAPASPPSDGSCITVVPQ